MYCFRESAFPRFVGAVDKHEIVVQLDRGLAMGAIVADSCRK